MAGGGQTNQQNPAAQAMQGANASTMPQGANNTQMGLAQLQQALQKLGGGQHPNAMQQFGQGLAGAAQGPQGQMRPQVMPQRPPMQAAPMQSATPPQMAPGVQPGMGMANGSMGMGGQGGMTPQMMNMLLARQNGLMS